MHWPVPGAAERGDVAGAGLRLVLRPAPGAGQLGQHGGQPQGLPGEAPQPGEQHQEQGPDPHRPAGGPR